MIGDFQRGRVRAMRHRRWLCLVVLSAAPLVAANPAGAQVNTAVLSGQVLDPQGLAVAGAKVTVKNLATGATRGTQTDETGRYRLVGLPPGRYELTVEPGKGLARLANPEIVLTIGQAAEFDAHVQLQRGEESVTVTESTQLIETTRTSVAETVNRLRIDNLPINGRNYVNFALTSSQVQRDSAPSIGAAPTSGLNFGGQRARSNQVSVDGTDAASGDRLHQHRRQQLRPGAGYDSSAAGRHAPADAAAGRLRQRPGGPRRRRRCVRAHDLRAGGLGIERRSERN